MIIDSSVLVAILLRKNEADSMGNAIADAPVCRISAVSYVESSVVIDSRRDPIFSRGLNDLLRQTQTIIEAVTPEQAVLAREACRDFGKGRTAQA